ncbi:MAG: substrate-binding domain-containing protein [Anaerolineae bacterium]|nr:substrate-binding domain-containing protein [Anaerolineae bacterium]
MPTPRLNKLIFLVYMLMTAGVFIAALASPAVRAVAYAPLRDLLLPPPRPIVVSVLYSTEKAAWLEEAVARFQATQPQVDGRPIAIQLARSGSREIYLAVLDGSAKPDIISPASTLQIHILQDLSAGQFGTPVVNAADRQTCRQVLRSPLVLVAWEERAQVLWGDQRAGDLWLQLQTALTDPGGWQKYGRPEWGYIKFGHTNPLKSNSGFQTILLMTYSYFGKTSGLTSADILGDEDYQAWFTAFEGAISRFGESTGTYMQEIVAYGPSMYDMVAVYEATAIEYMDRAVGRYGALRVYYPPATSMSDHPFCILQADWVTPEKARAAQMFLDYLTTPELQQLALLEHGFRPVEPGVPLEQPGSPFNRYAANGLRVDLPPEVETPPGDVLNTLLDFWARNIQR